MSEETKTETAPAAAPSANPAVAEVASESVGVGVLKDLTFAIINLSKGIQEAISTLAGTPEEPGVFERLDDLSESMDHLREAVGETNLHLARYSFVADRLMEIHKGDPAAQPPVPGRAPELSDIVAALEEFDRKLDEEAAKIDAEGEAIEGAAEAEAPPMISNEESAPRIVVLPKKELPPLPVLPERK